MGVGTAADRQRVLVKEKIADPGVELLREHFDVDIGIDLDDEGLLERIPDYDAIVIRSATQITGEIIERADRLKVIGRAGIGVDNVDVESATKRGIVVANAPESNIVAAAEHTLALMLAQCRKVPQAHMSLTAGKWDRSKFAGVEVYEKTLGILGFGRVGQLVAERAQAFGMKVVAYDPYVGLERYRELGVERVERPEDLYARADIISLHLPQTAETENFLDDAAFALMKDGVRIVNVARGGLLDLDALQRAMDSGKVAGASLDVFPEEPFTDHPILQNPNVVVTPHLGASTAEAQDRAGVITAEQVVAALTGGLVMNAVNIPIARGEDLAAVEPYMPLCTLLGRLAFGLAPAPSVDRVDVEFRGHLAEFDTRLLAIAVLQGAFQGRVEDQVNLVNAPALAEERGIHVAEHKDASAEDFTNLVMVRVTSGGESVEVGGTTIGARHLPHLVWVYGQSFNIELAKHMTFLRYLDVPGMVGKVGTILGNRGINIASFAVGREPDGDSSQPEGGTGGLAVMCVTTDQPVPDDVIEEILALDGFKDGRAVVL